MVYHRGWSEIRDDQNFGDLMSPRSAKQQAMSVVIFKDLEVCRYSKISQAPELTLKLQSGFAASTVLGASPKLAPTKGVPSSS